MNTKRSFPRTAWAEVMRARQFPPGNPARSGAIIPRVLLPCLAILWLAHAALAQAPATGSNSSAPAATPAADALNGEQKLQAARTGLHGPYKDALTARKLLLEILEQDKATLAPGSLCYVYVYLGYIEDRAANRTQAIAWYKQALALKDGDAIRGCAELGLKQPMTWIHHLDADTGPAHVAPAVSPLQAKVKFAARQASVQDIVQDLARQVGLGYDWQKSFSQTDPLCRRWVNNVAIEDKSCREALDQILSPVGLRYQVEDGVVVLYRK
jgi:hypothetical protein